MKTVWIIGAGNMALEYAKVLAEQKVNLIVIGRGESTAESFYKKTGIQPQIGGIEAFLKLHPNMPDKVIVAVSVEQLYNCVFLLIEYGIKDILCEKPGGVSFEQINKLSKLAKINSANVLLAYNRRFYTSVKKALEIIKEDGGLRSFNFEFTEWSHVIEKLEKDPSVKNNWFLANSSHVIDLAFYIGGAPSKLTAFSSGQNDLKWHPTASVFVGAGITKKNILFSYKSDWNAPGRWQLEFLTSKHRLYFSPIEKLRIQNLGEITIDDSLCIDYSLDEKYKPGLFLQVKDYIENKYIDLININNMSSILGVYEKILIGGIYEYDEKIV